MSKRYSVIALERGADYATVLCRVDEHPLAIARGASSKSRYEHVAIVDHNLPLERHPARTLKLIRQVKGWAP